MGEASVSIALLISITSLACTLVNTFIGGRKQHDESLKAENERQVQMQKEFVKVNFKLDEFCSSIRGLEKRYDRTAEELKRIGDRLIEDKLKLEDHEKRISKLEGGN